MIYEDPYDYDEEEDDWEEEDMNYCVSYKLLDKDDKVIKSYIKTACFSSMNYGHSKEVKKIIVFHTVDDGKFKTYFEEKQCAEWIKLINKFGFNVKYEGLGSLLYDTKEDEHLFVLDLSKKKDAKRAYCISALNLIRYLLEKGIYKIPEKFWELSEELEIKSIDDKFQLMQFCHQFVDYTGNSGHSLRQYHAQKCLSLKEFKKRAKDRTLTIYDSPYNSPFDYDKGLQELWQGEKVLIKENFEAVRDKKYMKVFVVGGANQYANWLPTEVKIVNKIKDAELVIFTGGTDVNPELYNEPRGKYTEASDYERDEREKLAFKEAKELEIPMVGICRGAQFLCVMNGGRLVQDQSQSGYIHPIETNKYGTIKISSTHHQAQYPFDLPFYDYNIIGWTTNESKSHLDGNNEEMNPPKECEIVYYPGSNCLCIQGHPEYTDYKEGYPEDLKVIQKIFTDFMQDNL